MAEEHFKTVRDLLDELTWYDLGGLLGTGWHEDHRFKLLGVEAIDDVWTRRVGFRVRYKDWTVEGFPEKTKDLWIRQHDAIGCGAWGRALSTPEGRSYVAGHDLGYLYWSKESPRDEHFGVVVFDP